MTEPTLTETFGASATQSSTILTLIKSDLAIVGFTPSASNTAESLLVAIHLFAARNLNEINRASDTVNRNVAISYGGQDLVQQGSDNFRRDVYSLLLYKTTALATVSPNDY